MERTVGPGACPSIRSAAGRGLLPLVLAAALVGPGCKSLSRAGLDVERTDGPANPPAGAARSDAGIDHPEGEAGGPDLSGAPVIEGSVSDGPPASDAPAGRAPGESCTTALECASGSCADGVCCQTSCAGICEACDLP